MIPRRKYCLQKVEINLQCSSNQTHYLSRNQAESVAITTVTDLLTNFPEQNHWIKRPLIICVLIEGKVKIFSKHEIKGVRNGITSYWFPLGTSQQPFKKNIFELRKNKYFPEYQEKRLNLTLRGQQRCGRLASI